MIALRCYVSLCLILFALPPWLPGEEPLVDFLSATCRVADKERSGTGFIFQNPAADAPRNAAIFVTAAHVFEQMNGQDCSLMLRAEQAEKKYERRVTRLQIREGDQPRWVRHPELDVAAIRLELPEGVAVKPLSLEQLATEQMLQERRVRVGQETWIACFPAKLEANEAGWPVLRRGSIATHPLVPIKSAKSIMIDFTTFGGDSGAPVAVIVDNQPLIVGLVMSMQRQTDRISLPFEERTSHMPLGLSIVAQAPLIRETIALLK